MLRMTRKDTMYIDGGSKRREVLFLTCHFHASFFESCSSEDSVRELVT